MSQWIVSQIGAREHYAVPRALRERCRLDHLYTDAWCRYGHTWFRQMPDPLRSFANRHHPGIPNSRVTSFTGWAVWNRLLQVLNSSESRDERYFEHHRRVGKEFATRVRDALKERETQFENTVFFGYNTASLEVLEFLGPTACTTVVDQIDPGRIEKEIVMEEADRWSDWVKSVPGIHERFERRLSAEWDAADWVVVNSKWSKEALVKQGVASDKIRIVPLAYEPPQYPANVEPPSPPLHVLWLGTVNLRKGIPYLVEAARQLEDTPVRFSIVGPIDVAESVVAEAPENLDFVGRVPRDRTSHWYRTADVFVLPTLSDGFAITQLEAMAHGLPVIATPNCGDVVTDGEDGLLIPPRDVRALIEAIMECLESPSRVEAMAHRAVETAQTFTLDRVADRLLNLGNGRG